jgi:hypothetical protein
MLLSRYEQALIMLRVLSLKLSIYGNQGTPRIENDTQTRPGEVESSFVYECFRREGRIQIYRHTYGQVTTQTHWETKD